MTFRNTNKYLSQFNNKYNNNNHIVFLVNVPLPNDDANSNGPPVAPPRVRHNPFDRNPAASHNRSHSIRSAPGRTDHDGQRQHKLVAFHFFYLLYFKLELY